MSEALATDVGGRKRAPLTLKQAVYLRDVQRAVAGVLQALGKAGVRLHSRKRGRDAHYWHKAPVAMTRLHSALPLADDRTFAMVELLDYYTSPEAARA